MLTQKKNNLGLLIFILISLIYFLSVRGNIEISDTYFSIQTAKSIVTNHSLSADGCQPGYCFQSQKDGKFYSRYGLGLAFIFTPYIILGKSIAPLINIPEDVMINFLISFYNIFFGAGACVIMFYLIKFFGSSNRNSVIMALLLGLGTFCWRYSAWDFSEAAQSFFLLLAIYCSLKNSLKGLGLGGLFFACLLLLKILYIIYLPIFILYILIKNRPGIKQALTHAGIFLFTALSGFALILFLNYLRFGEILEFGYGLEAMNFYLSGIKEHSARLLYWLDKGVLIYNPIFILGILGYYKFFRLFRKEAVFFLSIIALNFILTSAWYGWHGGWSWGPRYLVPVAGLWLLPCFVYFNKKGAIKMVLIALIFISLLIQGLSILQGNLEYLTICNANEKEGLRKGMPAQIIGSIMMLKHKIAKNDNVYKLSEFGIDSDTKVDISDFKYYGGVDLWYLNAAKYFNQPSLKFLPILFLPLILLCSIRLFRTAKEA
ncbi:MAG: hypothetical protein Q7K98_07265 [Candidatus Omnitrophota bacterium]|nr:hypothetical protein [Candidatus Omnitrophota bacterium]